MYVASDNTHFATAQEAWRHLAEEQERAEDSPRNLLPGESGPYSDTVKELNKRADVRWPVCDFERVGAFLDYSVQEVKS
jgi:hypothetical protein